MANGYQGASARTRRELVSFACTCGERFSVELLRAVDAAADPEAARALRDGEANRARCPACGAGHAVSVSVVYHDPGAEQLVLVLSDGLRHRELAERARLYDRLAADGAPAPAYVRRFEVVFGAAELVRLVGARRDETVVTPLRLVDPEPPARAPGPPVAAPTPARATATTPPPVRAPGPPVASPTPARASSPAAPQRPAPLPSAPAPSEHPLPEEDTDRRRMPEGTVPDTQSAAVERWIANREGPAAFLAEDRVIVCASLARPSLEPLVAAPLELRIQLHRMPSYPVVALTMLPIDATDPVLYACLDVARAAHRAVLDALARHCTLTLLLYDAEYLPVVARTLIAPLEENATRIGRDARDAWQRLSPQARSFERARVAFLAPGHDRLGRIQVTLSEVELGRLSSPKTLRAAVAAVGRWSEPGAEAYLVEVRSYPLPRWRRVRAEVVRASIEHGIHCPKALAMQVLQQEKIDADWPAVLRRQVSAFTEVALRIRQNDLSPEEEAENWRLLTAECQAAGVQLDPQVARLGRSADRRAQAVQGGGIDLRALDGPELTALLERKELRREAALILCERKEAAALQPIFAALRHMTRAEANRVLAALTFYGAAAEKQLGEGLRSRKSFVRQGCALALGAVGGTAAAELLAKALLEEPTDIWREIARALGDVGAESVAPLVSRLRASEPGDADAKERVARALAHVAGRGARGPVEMLGAGRDPVGADAARRALALEPEVRAGDLDVRGGPAPADQTVVRAFSRRFFEAMGGAVELSDDDLEMVEDEAEPLDEEDLQPAAEASDLPPQPTQKRPRLPSGRAP